MTFHIRMIIQKIKYQKETMMARLVLLASCGISLGLIAGCSNDAPDKPETGRVRGIVTLDGEIVPNVSVYFKPDEGRQSVGKTDDKGAYRAMYLIDEEGVKVGPNTVTLEYGPDDSRPPIPPRYGFKSELKFNVKPGKNKFDIKMLSTE